MISFSWHLFKDVLGLEAEQYHPISAPQPQFSTGITPPQQKIFSRWWQLKYFLFSPLFGRRFPFWRAYVSKGLVQPPTSILVETSMGFPTENLRVSWEPRSRDGHRHLVTWGKYTPLKIDSYSFSLGGCFFGFQPYFFREFCFRWWIMANPANQSKLSPFFLTQPNSDDFCC